ncbi:hypothetical protein [Allostreptomyces psammosilenae]|uniref:Integral membrane protein n=1 Tax=Allostreptomyces psammosilenae TaxID=1892865 RepID=A0A853A380_9ACTN|nr:hypothetical protein [Allostreptomyces psammosilenae]NYI04972.1 hypothetical protein [Allostreptomyces psammosilenae]
MSDTHRPDHGDAGEPAAPNDPATPAAPGTPHPDEVRFFGTTWVERGTAYRLRRVAVPVGALAVLLAGAGLLGLAVDGVALAGVGAPVEVLLLVAIGVCSVIAAARTWTLLARGRGALSVRMADDRAMGPVLTIGFLGVLAAYFVRSLVEAPGEAVRRAEYQAALDRRARARAARSRRPDARPDARRARPRRSGGSRRPRR